MKGKLRAKDIIAATAAMICISVVLVYILNKVTNYIFINSTESIVFDDGTSAVWSVDELPAKCDILEIVSFEDGQTIRENYSNGYSLSESYFLCLGKESLNDKTLSEIAQLDIREIILDVDFSNIDPLSNMQSLESLVVSRSAENFSPKFSGNFPNLKSLIIWAKIDSLGDISKITSLREFELGFTSFDGGISGIENLTNLEILDLSYTNVSDIGRLANLVKMRELYLDYTNVYDISALQNMKDLEVFSSQQNYNNNRGKLHITDITALANKPKLREVYLYGSDITDIAPLENDLALEKAELSYTGITSVKPLMNLKNLKEVGVYGCDGVNDSELEEFKNWLRSLDHDVIYCGNKLS